MVKYKATHLDTTFHALADPIRRAILGRLAVGEASVMEVAQPFRVSLPAVSRHIRVLEKAGLLTRKRHGRVHSLRLAARPLQVAAEWIEHYRRFWEVRFDALDRHLQEMMAQPHQGPREE
jgi:DNA-binding transcriptional ArsR family regulator